jgi:hypothetical protein
MSATNNIGYMAADEFLNTFTMMWAYDESKKVLKEYFPIDPTMSPYMKEALESVEQLVATMGIFKMVQYEERFLEKLFEGASALLVALLALSKKGYKKLSDHLMKGRRFKFMADFLGGVLDDAIEKAKLLVEWVKGLIFGRQSQYQSGKLIEASQTNRQNVVERDRSAMMMGQGMSENLINSLMFKLMTKTFNQQDETLLKKILGKNDVANLDISQINKIADFMFVTDINGNISGLSDMFMSLLVGQGVFKKSPSPTPLP